MSGFLGVYFVNFRPKVREILKFEKILSLINYLLE